MKRLRISLILLILSVLLAVFLSSCDNDSDTDDSSADTENPSGYTPDPDFVQPPLGFTVGKTAFSWKLPLVDGSGSVSISDMRGKVVVINFWGTWCNPCKSELPHFNELADEYADSVVFLTVHSVYQNDSAAEYITENFPDSKMIFAYDEVGTPTLDKYFGLLGGTSSYPRTLVLDKNGVITFVWDGIVSKSTLETEITNATN